MLHALRTASQLATGLTGSDREATTELLKTVESVHDDSVPEWQRKK
jgi:hypothetical protein